MIRIAPFEPIDLCELAPGPSAINELRLCDMVMVGTRWQAAGRCFTVRDATGRIVFCGGAIMHHAGHASLWAVMAGEIGRGTLARLLGAVRRFIASLGVRRIDATVAAGDVLAARWAAACGLHRETVLAEAGIDGSDQEIWRV